MRSLKGQKYLFFLFVGFLIVGSVFSRSLVTSKPPGVVSPATPTSPFSIASEEENIDDFSVHPASGRWNTTNDALTDDRIVDDNLRLITVDNTTTDIGGFEMNRDLRKTDGKVEWRSKADGSGNQTEYFRDSIGNQVDFEEGNDESFNRVAGVATTDTIQSGIMKIEIDAGGASVSYEFGDLVLADIPAEIYHTLVIRARASESGVTIKLFTDDWINFDGSVLTTDWEDYESVLTDDSDWVGIPAAFTIIFLDGSGNFEGDEIIFIEFIELIGDLDFATHIEGEIEDTWDWENGDYWEDVEGNISDFDDGSTEEWQVKTGVGATVNNDANRLNCSAPNIAFMVINTTGIAVDSSIYNLFSMDVTVGLRNIQKINITDSAGNDILNHGNILASTSDTVEGVFDADWAGVETDLIINITWNGANPVNRIFLDFTFILNGEGWTGLENTTISEGFFRGTMAAVFEDRLPSPAGLTLNTDRFQDFSVRLNTSDTTMDIHIEADLGAGMTDVTSKTDIDSTSQTIYSFDLSDDSDWTGTAIRIRIIFDESDGTLDGDEIVFVDYVLLTGDWAAADSVIGLYDDDVTGPLLNVTTHFFSNSSVGARFEVELLDLSGEIAYRYLDNNFTDLGDLWVRGKITYDSLRSSLQVDIKADNLTRIFRVTFPADFTEVSGRIPALFQLTKMSGIFISTATPAISWQELTIGYIRAPFKAMDWRNTDPPADSDYLENSPFFGKAQDNIADDSEWEFVVPSLDSVSGHMRAYADNQSTFDANDIVIQQFRIYGVDVDDGEKHVLAEIELKILFEAPNTFISSVEVFMGAGALSVGRIDIEDAVDPFTPNPAAQFTFAVRSVNKTRDVLDVKVRAFPDEPDETNFLDILATINIADEVDIISQEFVLFSRFQFTFNGDTNAYGFLDDFEFVERDIFSDIAGAIIEPIGNFISQIFTAAFRFLAVIFRIVGDLITVAIEIMTAALTVAISLVTTAVDLVTAAIDAMALIIADVLTELEGLAAAIATAVWEGIGTALDFITDAITDIASDVADAIVAVVGDIVDFLLTLITDIADLIDDVLQVIIPLLLTFLGTLLTDIAGFIEDVINTLIDLIIPAEITAVFEAMITAVTEIIGAIPTFIIDWMTFLAGVASIFVIVGFVVFFLLPIAQGATTGEFISHAIKNMSFDLTFGLNLLGFAISVPAVLPWIVLVVFQMLVGTPFIDFFS